MGYGGIEGWSLSGQNVCLVLDSAPKYPDQGYDVRDDTFDQVYRPESSDR